MILFFDCETTGLIPKGKNWETDYNDFPYIVQIAWIMDDEEKNYIIKPDGWYIPDEISKIHGITQGRAIEEGHPNEEVLEHFLKDAKKADLIVGHNIYFDTSIVKANLLRLGFDKTEIADALHKDKRYCTMLKSMKFMGSKYPKLSELYKYLFYIEFEDAHTALGDVRATKKCYEEMLKYI